MGESGVKPGWIYALYSENSSLIKIGFTTTSPQQRIREINASNNYGPSGPWMQLDIRQVKDTRAIETALHRRLASFRNTSISKANELFSITTHEARRALAEIPNTELLAPVPIAKLLVEVEFMSFLLALFQNSGLENFRDLQESWTFSLFPNTAGGRYFTLNIDRHEVAYSQPLKEKTQMAFHQIVVDHMVRHDKEVKRWLRLHNGVIRRTDYQTNWGHSSIVTFEATFDEARALFEIGSFRRALIAYWYEALLRMQVRGTRSLFAKSHNYNATSEIFRYLSKLENFRSIKLQ